MERVLILLSKVVGLRKFTYADTICIQTVDSCPFLILKPKNSPIISTAHWSILASEP
jgi:hypothetical protein